MIVSSLLGLLYLAPVALRALLPPQGEVASRGFIRPGGAPVPAVAALVVTAAMCVALFVFADEIVRYLVPIAERSR